MFFNILITKRLHVFRVSHHFNKRQITVSVRIVLSCVFILSLKYHFYGHSVLYVISIDLCPEHPLRNPKTV